MKLSEAIELQDAELAGIASDTTRDGYKAAIRAFVAFAGDIDASDVTPHLIRQWKVSMMKPQQRKNGACVVNRCYSQFTIAHRLKALKRLMRWLWREEVINKEPFRRVVIPSPKPTVKGLDLSLIHI